jgi:hypothetical protein
MLLYQLLKLYCAENVGVSLGNCEPSLVRDVTVICFNVLSHNMDGEKTKNHVRMDRMCSR